MAKGQIKKIAVVIGWILFSINLSAYAEDQGPVASPSPGETAQYQQWLDSMKQTKPVSSTTNAPAVTASTATAEKASQDNNVPAVESPPMTYEQSQAVMLKSAPPVSITPNPDSNTAFNLLMQQNMPLSPQQVIKLRQLIDASQRAASTPPTVPPKPVSTTLMMNLAPGSTPPAIRLAQGYVTSLVFVDSTGAPWPIAAYDVGDPNASTIQWDSKSNVLLIQAKSPYGDSDLVIRLVGLMTPLTVELVSGQRVVDFRTDIHVAGIGPNAKDLPTGTALPNSANQLLLNVLDGLAPTGSKLLSVKGGDCQAWLLGDKMYLRTRLTVLSPGWSGRMVSPDGMYAYEIQKSSSVLVSQYGEPIELKIEGF
jgi:intracellular multiplication protein IcmK